MTTRAFFVGSLAATALLLLAGAAGAEGDSPAAEAWMTPMVLDLAEAGHLEVSVRTVGDHSIEVNQNGAVRLRKIPKGCKLGGVRGKKLGWRLAQDAEAAVVHLPLQSARPCVGRVTGTIALRVCEGTRADTGTCKKTTVSFEGVVRIGDPPPPSVFPAAGRLIALGDVHGDLGALRAALKLAGLVDDKDAWTGGGAWVVQTGDQTDRGDDEREIFEFLERLRLQAHAAGGRLIILNGNHETMQASGDLRYVTPGGFDDFPEPPNDAAVRGGASPDQVARTRAFAPGSAWARLLSTRNLAVKVGDTVFVHGGVSPKWAEVGLEAFNAPTRAWLAGKGEAPDAITDPDGPVWNRTYSQEADAASCSQLEDALEALGATRMVVGHTVQDSGVTHACDKKVWRVDVGMAAHYGGKPSVIEIVGKDVRVLK
jgi:hypothetical protein